MNTTLNTPPYEYQQIKNEGNLLDSTQLKSIKSTTHHHQSMILSPPELVMDTSEDEEENMIESFNEIGLLWSIRQRVSLEKTIKKKQMKLFTLKKRVRPMRIQIPRPHGSQEDIPHKPKEIKSEQKIRPKTSHPSSGRPARIKGPCQACQETSDGCMRKAFDWPLPTNSILNDKGRPFVYLCNKCGLRYNKSGGCVCRNCRWVLCKEEKRKAMQLIDQMRRSRPDGKVDPDEDIIYFTCTPKYWSCSHPWKVGWVLNSQHDIDDEDDEEKNMI